MALNGSFGGKTSNSRIKPTLWWSAVQSVEGNYSDITAILTYKRTNDQVTGGSWSGTLTIDDQVFKGSKRFNITNDMDAEAIRATARVYHDDYGALTVTLSATGAISGSTLTSTTISGEITLDTIARASGISATNADIGSRSTVVISRKNDGFTHSIAYSFGTLSGYIDASGNTVDTEEKLSATTVNFLLPESFYDQIPDAPKGVCRLTCTTYRGDTRIGSVQTGEFTVSAGFDGSKPLVSGRVWDVSEKTAALTGDASVLVRYASVARCQIDATARNGARITSLRIGGQEVTESVLDIAAPAFETVTFEATDSRGYTAISEVPVQMIPYVILTNNATLQRTDPTSGDAVLQFDGNCWQGSFGAVNNALAYELTVDGGNMQYDQLTIGEDSTYQETKKLSGLDYRTAHTVALTVSDAVMSVTKTLTVSKGIPVFDWGEEDFRFNVPVAVAALTVDGVSLKEYIQSVISGG